VNDISRYVSAATRPPLARPGEDGLVEALAKQWQNVVGLGVAAQHRLREDELSVEMHVEDPVRAGNDLD
jgi:hypothetical protein